MEGSNGARRREVTASAGPIELRPWEVPDDDEVRAADPRHNSA